MARIWCLGGFNTKVALNFQNYAGVNRTNRFA